MASKLKNAIKNFAESKRIDLIGFVSTNHLEQVTPTKYKPSRLWKNAKTAISIGQHLLKGAMEISTNEMLQNARWVAWRTNELLNHRALELALFIESLGVKALPLSNGTMIDPGWKNQGIFGELSHRHVAAEAGLGIIGVPTYLVTPQFGPRVYFNTILTDAEIEPDPKLDWNPCTPDCNECIKACPTHAIIRNRRTIKKTLCIPRAMPHGVRKLQEYFDDIMKQENQNDKKELLYNYDFARFHRALVQGVGTIAGCFYCIDACPIGK